MEQIIECNNLTHYYGKRLIYENLSFTVPKGRILGLFGYRTHPISGERQFHAGLDMGLPPPEYYRVVQSYGRVCTGVYQSGKEKRKAAFLSVPPS